MADQLEADGQTLYAKTLYVTPFSSRSDSHVNSHCYPIGILDHVRWSNDRWGSVGIGVNSPAYPCSREVEIAIGGDRWKSTAGWRFFAYN